MQSANSEQRAANSGIGIAGLGAYPLPEIVTSRQLAAETGIPADVIRDKFGVDQVHRAGEGCHVSDVAAAAGAAALADAAVAAEEVDLVVYCGGEF